MQAKITHPQGYRCAPDGALVKVFAFGSIVSGQVAIWAMDEKAAVPFSPVEETKVIAAPETKARRGRK